LDDKRLGEALEGLLEEHRRNGSPAEELIARGAKVFIQPAGNGRAEVRIGWLDDWHGPNVSGRGMRLGFIAVEQLSTERGCRST
jgi:hypothetical protein